jgi:hypothetical protein
MDVDEEEIDAAIAKLCERFGVRPSDRHLRFVYPHSCDKAVRRAGPAPDRHNRRASDHTIALSHFIL